VTQSVARSLCDKIAIIFTVVISYNASELFKGADTKHPFYELRIQRIYASRILKHAAVTADCCVVFRRIPKLGCSGISGSRWGRDVASAEREARAYGRAPGQTVRGVRGSSFLNLKALRLMNVKRSVKTCFFSTFCKVLAS